MKTGTLDVVDYVLHEGTISFEESSDAPFYTLRGDLPDWTEVKYTILPTRFERNQ